MTLLCVAGFWRAWASPARSDVEIPSAPAEAPIQSLIVFFGDSIIRAWVFPVRLPEN
jgi:hypothetical protein